MALTYLSRQGDCLDEIAFNQYGQCSAETLAAVLLANPGIADLGPLLPAGLQIVLPDAAPVTTTVPGVSLWD